MSEYKAPDIGKHLGRTGPATKTFGMWPNGESQNIRDSYDQKINMMGTTKICYNCGGSGTKNGKQCTACHGSGTVPSVR